MKYSGSKIINAILKNEQISANKFAKEIGLDRTQPIYDIINGDVKKVTPNYAKKIIDRYPKYNYEWLTKGVGEMLIKENTIITQPDNSNGVPFYDDINSTGGILTSYNDIKEVPTFYINYEHFNDCTAYLTHVGDSMYPKYCAGEIIAIKKIDNLDVMQWGEAYLVVTNENANSMRTVKLVFSVEGDNSKLCLRASNPNFKGDTIIEKKDIVSIYIVKGKITRNQL